MVNENENIVKNNDDFDMELENILLEEEEDNISYNNLPPERRTTPDSVAELEMQKEKAARLEAQLNQLSEKIESGQKVNFMEGIFKRYQDIDPSFKQMVAEILHGYNQASQAELAPLFEHLNSLKKDIIKTQKNIESVHEHLTNVQGSIAFDKLVKKYLQRGFKKNSITEDVVEAAKKLHEKKLNDESYYLRVDNILTRTTITPAQKDKLIGQLILDSYREEVIKSNKKKKLAEGSPELKKKVEKDEDVEKAQKKLEQENKEEVSKLNEDISETPKELTEAEKEENRELIKKRIHRLRGY